MKAILIAHLIQSVLLFAAPVGQLYRYFHEELVGYRP